MWTWSRTKVKFESWHSNAMYVMTVRGRVLQFFNIITTLSAHVDRFAKEWRVHMCQAGRLSDSPSYFYCKKWMFWLLLWLLFRNLKATFCALLSFSERPWSQWSIDIWSRTATGSKLMFFILTKDTSARSLTSGSNQTLPLTAFVLLTGNMTVWGADPRLWLPLPLRCWLSYRLLHQANFTGCLSSSWWCTPNNCLLQPTNTECFTQRPFAQHDNKASALNLI